MKFPTLDDLRSITLPSLTATHLHAATRHLRTANEVLNALYHAREGGPLSQVLAVAGAAGTILHALYPEKSAYEQLTEAGFRDVGSGLGGFFTGLLMRSEWPRNERLLEGGTVRIVTWSVGVAAGPDTLPAGFVPPPSIAAIFEGDSYSSGPYVRGEGMLGEALRRIVWGAGVDFALDADVIQSRGESDDGPPRRGRSTGTYRLLALPEPPAYHGKPGVDWYTKRLVRHDGQTRAALIVGSTGIGKSLLARHIARAVSPGARSLKISGAALSACPVGDLVLLATHLQPDALILDDVAQIEGWNGDAFSLALFEALRGPAKLVIGTLMEDGGPRRGSGNEDYYPGMRPGRMDEVWRLKRPDPGVRAAILSETWTPPGTPAGERLLAEILKATEGLTGAYLAELGHRLNLHGTKTWKSEVVALHHMAPKERKPRSLRRRKKATLAAIHDAIDAATAPDELDT